MFLLLIAICVSFDALLAGLFLGFKKIKITLLPLLGSSILFMLFSLVGFALGHATKATLSPYVESRNTILLLSDLILLCLGIFYIIQEWVQNKKKLPSTAPENQMYSPSKVDRDQSGSIEFFEAFILSVFLSVDTTIAIVSLSMMQPLSFFSALLFGILQSVFLITGILVGKMAIPRHLSLHHNIRWIHASPGYLLILIVVFRFFLR